MKQDDDTSVCVSPTVAAQIPRRNGGTCWRDQCTLMLVMLSITLNGWLRLVGYGQPALSGGRGLVSRSHFGQRSRAETAFSRGLLSAESVSD